MSDTTEVIIVGGGIMGLATAWFLIEQGLAPWEITLVEKTAFGAGSTGKSGAILRQHYSHEVTVRMAREGLGFYSTFAERTGRDIGFVGSGMCFVCADRDRPALEANVALQRSLGVDTSIIDAAGLRAVEPRAVFQDDAIAALEPEAGFVDPRHAANALASELAARGVDLRVGLPVVGFLADAGRVRGVELGDGGIVEGGWTVSAGGPWTRGLIAGVGLDLPLTVVRPEQAYLFPPREAGPESLVFGDLFSGLYWKPESAGFTRVGNLAYADDAVVEDPDQYDEGVSQAFIRHCRARLAERVPAYARSISWGGCGAMYTITPDAHPLVGAVPGLEGLLLAAGFSGHGFKMSPSVGRGLAAMITGTEQTAFDPAFFAVDRYDRGAPITSAYEYGILG